MPRRLNAVTHAAFATLRSLLIVLVVVDCGRFMPAVGPVRIMPRDFRIPRDRVPRRAARCFRYNPRPPAHADWSLIPDFREAIQRVRDGAGTALVTGSFHTVGDVMVALGMEV